jgi:hypothetical protein
MLSVLVLLYVLYKGFVDEEKLSGKFELDGKLKPLLSNASKILGDLFEIKMKL